MQLKDYIKGNRRGKEANRLERQAMNDKFLQEALDGFDAVACDHIQVIERLEKKIAATAATPQNKRNIFFYVSIAASILLLIGFGVYFLPERNGTKNAMVMLQADEREMDYAATPSSPVLSEQSEEAPESKMNERQVSAEKRVREEQREQTVNIVTAEDIIEEEMSQVSTLVAAKKIAAKSAEILPVEEQEDTVALESDNITFGKKEFQAYCRQKAGKNVCDGKKVTVKVSFFIDKTGKPTDIKYNRYTCEEAKKEIERLLSSSPRWTTVNKKVTMTVKWQ